MTDISWDNRFKEAVSLKRISYLAGEGMQPAMHLFDERGLVAVDFGEGWVNEEDKAERIFEFCILVSCLPPLSFMLTLDARRSKPLTAEEIQQRPALAEDPTATDCLVHICHESPDGELITSFTDYRIDDEGQLVFESTELMEGGSESWIIDQLAQALTVRGPGGNPDIDPQVWLKLISERGHDLLVLDKDRFSLLLTEGH